jgi:predicted phosphoribosyltransferase
MDFLNREEAAHLLADRLANYAGQRPLVLAVPRGAIPMARIIADALHGELDVVLVRKLRAPGDPELAIGAVDEVGIVLASPYAALVAADYLHEQVRTQQEILRRRRALYSRDRPPIDVRERVVIIVDDGIVTGASMLAAVRAVRARRPKRLVVASAVAPAHVLNMIGRETDDVVCLHAAREVYNVGQFFVEFPEVSDDMVVSALENAAHAVVAH